MFDRTGDLLFFPHQTTIISAVNEAMRRERCWMYFFCCRHLERRLGTFLVLLSSIFQARLRSFASLFFLRRKWNATSANLVKIGKRKKGLGCHLFTLPLVAFCSDNAREKRGRISFFPLKKKGERRVTYRGHELGICLGQNFTWHRTKENQGSTSRYQEKAHRRKATYYSC